MVGFDQGRLIVKIDPISCHLLFGQTQQHYYRNENLGDLHRMLKKKNHLMIGLTLEHWIDYFHYIKVLEMDLDLVD